MSDTIDSKGASELLHVSVKHVQELARRGEIPAVWIAGQWVFVRDELLAYLIQRSRDEQKQRRETQFHVDAVVDPSVKRKAGRPRKAA
jgi:excisionase family DNA binding protein